MTARRAPGEQRMRRSSRSFAQGLVALVLVLAGPGVASAETASDCLSQDNERRIAGCTVVIEDPSTPAAERGVALSMRALALSLKGLFDRAIEDYDASLRINPNSATALNNRAWAYFRSGRAPKGLPDIERSLLINPNSPHSWDTRAHIRQVTGDVEGAIRDYEMAATLGGKEMVKLYQCGLAERGLFKGSQDGVFSEEVRTALHSCVRDRNCDPLPADEQCKLPTS